MIANTPDGYNTNAHVSASVEDQFREKFLALVSELATPGQYDPEAMTVIGLLARRLMDDERATSWGAYKRGQTRALYDATLQLFQRQGNALLAEKKLRTAYAIQVLAMSLIARTQLDADVQAGDRQLDGIIDFAATQTKPTGGAPN